MFTMSRGQVAGAVVSLILLLTGDAFPEGLSPAGAVTQPATSPASAPASAPATSPASKPARPEKIKITISKETTYLLGPLNEDGTVNYVAAMNERLGKGVTPENNAFVLFLRALGPEMIDERTRSGVFKRLCVAPPAPKGDYLVAYQHFIRALPEGLQPKMSPEAREAKGEIDKLQAELDVEGRKLLSGKSSGGEITEAYLHKYNDMSERVAALRKQYPQPEDVLQQQYDGAFSSPWLPGDRPAVAAWLKANERPLALIVEASRRPRYYSPPVSETHPDQMVSTLLPRLGGLREAGKALTARAMMELAEGKVEQAAADLLAVQRLARLTGQSATLIERLVSIALEGLSAGGFQALAASGKLTADQAKSVLADLQALPPPAAVVEVIDEFERAFLLDCVMIVAREGERAMEGKFGVHLAWRLQPNFSAIDYDIILRMTNRWFDLEVSGMRKPAFAERVAAHKAFDKEAEAFFKPQEDNGLQKSFEMVLEAPAARRRELSEAVGKAILASLLPSLGRSSVLQDRATMNLQLAKIGLAMTAYKAEKGAYPKTLDELAPAYLKQVPLDLFTDKPLIYKPSESGYLLYSVGENMKDDGGRDKAAGGDDLAVRAGDAPIPTTRTATSGS